MKTYFCSIVVKLSFSTATETAYVVAEKLIDAKDYLKNKLGYPVIAFSGHQVQWMEEPGHFTRRFLERGKPFLTRPHGSALPCWTD